MDDLLRSYFETIAKVQWQAHMATLCDSGRVCSSVRATTATTLSLRHTAG